MNDRIVESNDQPIVDSRANLFYFLQTLAGEAHARAIAPRDFESSITDEQIAVYKKSKGMV